MSCYSLGLRAPTRASAGPMAPGGPTGQDGAAGYDLRHGRIRSSPRPAGTTAVVVIGAAAGVDHSGVGDGRSEAGDAAVHADTGERATPGVGVSRNPRRGRPDRGVPARSGSGRDCDIARPRPRPGPLPRLERQPTGCWLGYVTSPGPRGHTPQRSTPPTWTAAPPARELRAASASAFSSLTELTVGAS